MNYQEFLFNQFDVWKLCEKLLIYTQRNVLFLMFKFPCSLQLSTKCSFRALRNYSDAFLISYLPEHVCLNPHFIFYHIKHTNSLAYIKQDYCCFWIGRCFCFISITKHSFWHNDIFYFLEVLRFLFLD